MSRADDYGRLLTPWHRYDDQSNELSSRGRCLAREHGGGDGDDRYHGLDGDVDGDDLSRGHARQRNADDNAKDRLAAHPCPFLG